MKIKENYLNIRKKIPEHVTIVAAAKTRTKEEIIQVIEAGLTDIGENYIQEAENLYRALGERAKQVKWHMIGHVQTNKINKALALFDVIQTVDSLKKANAINTRAGVLKKVIPVYIEVNIGNEITKTGVKPEYKLVEGLVIEMSKMEHLMVEGLMTMGPRTGDPEAIRPFFRKTKEIFDKIKALHISNVNMDTLSMGMSNSYAVAIEEGSTMVRLGTVIFGEREYPY